MEIIGLSILGVIALVTVIGNVIMGIAMVKGYMSGMKKDKYTKRKKDER